MFGFECKIPIHALIWQAKKPIMYCISNAPSITSKKYLPLVNYILKTIH